MSAPPFVGDDTALAATLKAAGIRQFADSRDSEFEDEESWCRRAYFPPEGSQEPRRPKCPEVPKENTMVARCDRAVGAYVASYESTKEEQFAELRHHCQNADGKFGGYRQWCLWAMAHMKQLHHALARTRRLVAIQDAKVERLEQGNTELQQVLSHSALDLTLKEFRDAAAVADKAAKVVTEWLEEKNETLQILRRDQQTALLAGQEQLAKDRQEWAAAEKSKLQDFRTAVMWEAIHLTHHKTATTMGGRAIYTTPVAWEHKEGKGSKVILNPDHPYWMGRRFADWLQKGKHLSDSRGPWFRADKLPGHPLSLFPMQGNQDLSWFQGIDHGLINAEAPELPTLNLLPPGEFYQNLAKQQE